MSDKKNSYIEYKDADFYYLHSGEQTKKGTTSYNTHNHPKHEIMYVSNGAVEYLVENRRHELKKGDVLLVKPGLLHVGRIITEAPHSRFCVGFVPDAIENGRLAESLFEMGEHFTVGENSIFSKLVELVKEKLEEGKENTKQFIKHVIDSMILSLADAGLGEEKLPQPTDSTLRRIINYVDANLTTIKSCDDIAEALFFSKSYIGHLFKRETGIGIMEYVRTKKVLRAHKTILSGEKPTEIYTECGFSNYPSFYRAYCAYFGESPKNTKVK